MRRHIKTVHEGHKDFKCKSSERSFTYTGSVSGHIKNILKGHKHDFPHESHLKYL